MSKKSSLYQKYRFALASGMLLLFLLPLTCGQVRERTSDHRQQLSEVNPATIGMSADRLNRIDAVLNQYVSNKWIPGAVALIARHGKIGYFKSFGSKEMDGQELLQRNDIFRIASMTKAVTAVAAMMLYEEGKFLLDDPVSKYIPEFESPRVMLRVNKKDSSYTSRDAKGEVKIRDLFTHTSGLVYGGGNPDLGPVYAKADIPDGFVSSENILAEKMKLLAGLPLLHDPGEKWTYGLSTDMLGYLVEALSGLSLNDFFIDRIFDPLGMHDTHFFLPAEKVGRLVPVYADVQDAEEREEALETARYPYEGGKSYYSGGSGLVSTALDYAKFIQMLLYNGRYNEVRFLSRKSVDLIRTNQIGDLWGDGAFGLGFGITTDKNSYQKLGSAGNYWWGGYYSTIFWIDPQEDLIAVLMKQIYASKHEDLHEKFEILTYQSIID